jgi:hypothetical protein
MTPDDFREWVEGLETQTLTEQLKLDIIEEFNQFLEDNGIE